MEDKLWQVLYGDDNWVGFTPSPSFSLDDILARCTLNEDTVAKYAPFLSCVDSSIHCALVNWLNHTGNPGDVSAQELVLKGLGNIMTHGSAKTRLLASDAFATIQGMGSYPTWGSSSCRICWGESTQLDDCRSQGVIIGPFSFGAIDYGDTIPLTESMQRNLNNEDRSERNQCALIALAAGLVIRTKGQERFLPSASRVLHMASELRQIEWAKANSYMSSP